MKGSKYIPRNGKVIMNKKQQDEQEAAKIVLFSLRLLKWAVDSGLHKDSSGWWFGTNLEKTYSDAEIISKFFNDTKDKTND